MNIPLVADLLHSISRDYGVLKEEEGIAYRFEHLNICAGLLSLPFCLQSTIPALVMCLIQFMFTSEYAYYNNHTYVTFNIKRFKLGFW